MQIARPRAQRIVQICSIILYLGLIVVAIKSRTAYVPDLYLRMDPVIALNSSVATRSVPPRLILGIILLALPLVLGRFYCGWLCPMGAAIDLADWLAGKRRRARNRSNKMLSGNQKWRCIKVGLLFFFLGSSFVGITTYFYASPISLLNRFCTTVLYPVLIFTVNSVLDIVRPLLDRLGYHSLYYMTMKERVFSTDIFVFVFVSGIFALSFLSKRFWCRYICPSGAILGLLSTRPLVRRKVSGERCTHCGLCRQSCPMGAIQEDPINTSYEECLLCLKCSGLCPVGAIDFDFKVAKPQIPVTLREERRKILFLTASGILAGALFYVSPSYPGNSGDSREQKNTALLRPPGSVPETDFLARCARCYECVLVCPTNTLQPAWFEGGLVALWTPKVTTSLAPCAKDCALCGHVCPTGAIRPIPLKDKVYCKIGTAHICRNRCLAWEHDRKCLVCDEVCPYDAVTFIAVENRRNRVPVVNANRCTGCGYCETHCPVSGKKAIVVETFGEVRISGGSFKDEAKKRNLKIRLKSPYKSPGIRSEDSNKELPPGFDFSR